ncbi:MAG: hypothetical protein FJ291_25215, partial [Planctomycetes bacterium]|nr:hypothetical protein [Planctomycetota bacterium]
PVASLAAIITLASLSCARLGEGPGRQSGWSQEAWEGHRDALRQRPDIVRFYTFEAITPEASTVPSLAGEREALAYVPVGGASLPRVLQVVEGRWPGKKAVRLDAGYFEAKPFEVRDKAFTVELWFRKHGQGAERGNSGATNGMLFAQGDGYWSGLRVWTSYPARNLVFEVGRPQPGHAFALAASDAVPDGVWHHLAATWDGREMRLYLNGLLLKAAEFAGDYTAPKAPFRVGFANAGIGSLKMDVDEVAVYNCALSPGEILRSAYFHAPLRADAQARFERATEATVKKDWRAACAELRAVLALRALHPEYRALARLALGRTLDRQNHTIAALKEYTTVADDAAAPEGFREMALRLCARAERGVGIPGVSRSVCERLLKLPELSEAERVGTRMALADACLREGDHAAARKHFAELAESPGLPESDRWSLRLQVGHSLLAEKEYPLAGGEYLKLAEQSAAPPEVRALAMLSAAHAFTRAGDNGGAATVFGWVRDFEAAPKHLRLEAEERIAEIERLKQGLPARDPAASRVKVGPFPKPGATFYVAADGSDANPGTKERPFASLSRARDAIRELKKAGGLPAGGVEVLIRGGVYRATKTFELAEEDSGTDHSPIVYRAFPGEKPRFLGGVRISGFKKAHDNVWQADLKAQGITDFGKLAVRGFGMAGYPCNPWVDLYVDGKPMQLARWPNTGFVKMGDVAVGRLNTPDSGKPGVFRYDDDRPARWSKPSDAWVFGCWAYLWEGRCLKVASFDTEKRLLTTVQPSCYGFQRGQPYYYFNILEELDAPGEWYLDREAGVLYLYPPSDISKAVIEFPLLEAPFVKMTNVSHVVLRGLAFELGRAEGAVVLGGRHNLLAGCTFARLGTNGVIIEAGTEHVVLGCDIHTLGAGGLRVAGGDRKSLSPARHVVENCHVRDFSRVDRVYAPAVHLDGVGGRISHNLFHDSPHHGMRVEGYDHAIEFNEIHSVVWESDDQAGIDMFGNPAYRGNAIRYNFWHHIGSGHHVAGQGGIRLDDMISSTLLYGNVFYRCSGGHFGGIQIHGGKDNIADNNLFIECKFAVSFSPWGQKLYESRVTSEGVRKAVAMGGVDITQPPHSARYPDLARIAEGADRNFLWRNLAVRCGRFTTRDRGVNELLDNHALADDPGFADPTRRDFRLSDASPVYDRFPFRPIPWPEIGLYPDEFRATWPVEHDITPHFVNEP